LRDGRGLSLPAGHRPAICRRDTAERDQAPPRAHGRPCREMRPAYPLRNHCDHPAWLPCPARTQPCAFSFIFQAIIATIIAASGIIAMRTRGSESFIVLPLLP